LRGLPVKYHVVYHGQSGNQFRPGAGFQKRVRRFPYSHEQRSAVACDFRQPARMRRQQRIE